MLPVWPEAPWITATAVLRLLALPTTVKAELILDDAVLIPTLPVTFVRDGTETEDAGLNATIVAPESDVELSVQLALTAPAAALTW